MIAPEEGTAGSQLRCQVKGVDVVIPLYHWFFDWINLWFSGLETSMLIKSCSLGPNMLSKLCEASNSSSFLPLKLRCTNWQTKNQPHRIPNNILNPSSADFTREKSSPKPLGIAWTVSSRTNPMQPIPWCNTGCCSGKVYGETKKMAGDIQLKMQFCKLCTYVRSLHHDRK